jgi:hypothetical protein
MPVTWEDYEFEASLGKVSKTLSPKTNKQNPQNKKKSPKHKIKTKGPRFQIPITTHMPAPGR